MKKVFKIISGLGLASTIAIPCISLSACHDKPSTKAISVEKWNAACNELLDFDKRNLTIDFNFTEVGESEHWEYRLDKENTYLLQENVHKEYGTYQKNYDSNWYIKDSKWVATGFPGPLAAVVYIAEALKSMYDSITFTSQEAKFSYTGTFTELNFVLKLKDGKFDKAEGNIFIDLSSNATFSLQVKDRDTTELPNDFPKWDEATNVDTLRKFKYADGKYITDTITSDNYTVFNLDGSILQAGATNLKKITSSVAGIFDDAASVYKNHKLLEYETDYTIDADKKVITLVEPITSDDVINVKERGGTNIILEFTE